jgi:hypothetical protein
MHALLVLGDLKGSLSVVVNVRSKETERKFYALLEGKRNREAFDLLKNKAVVEEYLSPGKKLPLMPKVTLIEALL